MKQPDKAVLINLITSVQNDLYEVISELPDQRLNSAGSLENWSIKNMVSHVTFWINYSCLSLDAIHSGTPPADYDDIDKINDEVVLSHQNEPWTEVKADMDQAFQQILEKIESCSDEDLFTPGRFAWLNGKSFFDHLVGAEAWHVEYHLADFLIHAGEAEKSNRLYLRFTEELAEIQGWKPTAYYNLGCYYALQGKKQAAIAALKQSLPYNASLLEWSKKDTDLDLLRDDPEYLAMLSTIAAK